MQMNRLRHEQGYKNIFKKMVWVFVCMLWIPFISIADHAEAANKQSASQSFSDYKEPHFLYVSLDKDIANYNGVTLKAANKPYFENNRLMLPVRWIAEYVGLAMSVDGNRVVLTDDKYTWVFESNSHRAFLNGENMNLSVASKGHGEQMFVPVRIFMEAYSIEFFDHYNLEGVYTLVRYTDVPIDEDKLLHYAHNIRRVGHSGEQWSIAYPMDWKEPYETTFLGKTYLFKHRYYDLTLALRIRDEDAQGDIFPLGGLGVVDPLGIYDDLGLDLDPVIKEKPRVGKYQGNTFYEYSSYTGSLYVFARTMFMEDKRVEFEFFGSRKQHVIDQIPFVNTFTHQYQLGDVPTKDLRTASK